MSKKIEEIEKEKIDIIEKNIMVKEEQKKSNIKINELINKIKVLEEDKKTILNENNNKENIIIESNKYIEEYYTHLNYFLYFLFLLLVIRKNFQH